MCTLNRVCFFSTFFAHFKHTASIDDTFLAHSIILCNIFSPPSKVTPTNMPSFLWQFSEIWGIFAWQKQRNSPRICVVWAKFWFKDTWHIRQYLIPFFGDTKSVLPVHLLETMWRIDSVDVLMCHWFSRKSLNNHFGRAWQNIKQTPIFHGNASHC